MRPLRQRTVINIVLLFVGLYLTCFILFAEKSLAPPRLKQSQDIDTISFPKMEYDFVQSVRGWIEDGVDGGDEALQSLSAEDQSIDKVEDEKMNWHDLDLINRENLRVGDGEQGQPVFPTSEEMNAIPEKFKDIGYNVAASLKVSLDRSFPDLRDPSCQWKLYRKNLPQASFILPFHNELNTTLLRSVHSIVKHSPPDLLKEIILVDDASTDVELSDVLDRYLEETFPQIAIRVIRVPVKRGLMNARSLGASYAEGDVLVIFDAHIEVGINFLPPLLDPIAENYKTITNPIIGVIDNQKFSIYSKSWYAGGVNTKMNFTYFEPNPKYVARPTEPFPNPVMVGCAFAISKKWWEELEGYDPLLTMWGSEQFELSLKTWMCGGSQVNIPCSRIAHLFRPRKEGSSNEDVVSRENNMHRVALAWMDEYVDYVYLTYTRLLKIDPGDVSPQIRLRRKLNCKNFDWFMHNVQPEILQMDTFPQRDFVAWGTISDRYGIDRCLRIREALGFPEFILVDCKWGDDGLLPEHFHYSIKGFLSTTVRKPSKCLFPTIVNNAIGLAECNPSDTSQIWSYNSVSGNIINLVTKMCIEKDIFNSTVKLKPCKDKSAYQSWNFQFMDPNVKFY